jgi:hypothetical protein
MHYSPGGAGAAGGGASSASGHTEGGDGDSDSDSDNNGNGDGNGPDITRRRLQKLPDPAAIVWNSCEQGQYIASGSVYNETDPPRCKAVLAACLPPPRQYQRAAPTPTSDRVCEPVAQCGASQFERAPPTNTSDRVCEPVTARCDAGSEYEADAPTPTSDRRCKALRVCNTVVVAATAVAAAAAGIPGGDSAGSNATQVQVRATQYISRRRTLSDDRECSSLSPPCDNRVQYQSLSPTAFSNRACTNRTSCDAQAGFYRPSAPASDGGGGGGGGGGADGGGSGSSDGDSVCKAHTACNASQFERVQPTSTSDRVCGEVSLCGDRRQYETAPPTLTSDRECAALTVCGAGEYEARAGTVNTDRECAVKKTVVPTSDPTVSPSDSPTSTQTTLLPTASPTALPTEQPTTSPTALQTVVR